MVAPTIGVVIIVKAPNPELGDLSAIREERDVAAVQTGACPDVWAAIIWLLSACRLFLSVLLAEDFIPVSFVVIAVVAWEYVLSTIADLTTAEDTCLAWRRGIVNGCSINTVVKCEEQQILGPTIGMVSDNRRFENVRNTS